MPLDVLNYKDGTQEVFYIPITLMREPRKTHMQSSGVFWKIGPGKPNYDFFIDRSVG